MEAGDTGTVGGGCRGSNSTPDKAGDTEETAVEVRGGKTTADETGDGEGARNPQSEQISSAPPQGRHGRRPSISPQPRKGKPPSTRNRNHQTWATHPKQEPQAPHRTPPLQQEPHQDPHHPPGPHQHQTHHPRTLRRNISQKKHQHTLHPHIPPPTYEEAKHPYPYENTWGQVVGHRSCHPLQEAPRKSQGQASPQPAEHDPTECQPQRHGGRDRHPQRRQEKEKVRPVEGKGASQKRDPAGISKATEAQTGAEAIGSKETDCGGRAAHTTIHTRRANSRGTQIHHRLGTTKSDGSSGGGGRPRAEDKEDDGQDWGCGITTADESGDTDEEGGDWRGGKTAANAAGGTEEEGGDWRGGKTAADGTGGVGTDHTGRAAFFRTTTSPSCSSTPPAGGNHPHEDPEPSNAGKAPEAGPKGPTPAPPRQQAPYQGTHHPPEPHQFLVHHPRTLQRNSSQKCQHHTPQSRKPPTPLSVRERLGTGR
ncbi:uncharacterized protein [Procambarus clarkii]|uniref:uncharacterized protein n=1 Tax=Procambarus clarkii TaxID=6728 RepID=UPI003743CC77